MAQVKIFQPRAKGHQTLWQSVQNILATTATANAALKHLFYSANSHVPQFLTTKDFSLFLNKLTWTRKVIL